MLSRVLQRAFSAVHRPLARPSPLLLPRRNMGGGGGGGHGGGHGAHEEIHASKIHTNAGELFGFVAWFWIFYRCKEDGAVVLGLWHPWENHAHDEGDTEHHYEHGEGGVAGVESLQKHPTHGGVKGAGHGHH